MVDGIELNEDIRNIERVRQEVGMVFQHFNLFPHLTVLQNCTLAPIWVRKMPKKEAEALAMHYLERVRIAEHANKFRSDIGWPTAARGYRPLALYEAENYAV